MTLGLCSRFIQLDIFIGFVELISLLLLTWIGVCIVIFIARLRCEWIIIVVEWIIETTKAALLNVENSKKEEKK